MKKIFSSATSIIISVCFLYGCVTGGSIPDPYYVNAERQKRNVYHAPATKNTPLLTEKNQILFGANYSSTPKLKGAEIQFGYMPTDHFGFMGSYRGMNYKDPDDEFRTNNSSLGSLKGFEFGAGYVSRLSDIMHIESYLGYSKSNMKNIHHTGISEIGQNNFFIQPALGMNTTNNKIQFAIMSRVSRSIFNIEKETYNKDREQIVATSLDAIRNDPKQFFIEPGLVLRYGSEMVKAQLSYSILHNLSGGKIKSDDRNFSIGLIVQTPAKQKNKKKPAK